MYPAFILMFQKTWSKSIIGFWNDLSRHDKEAWTWFLDFYYSQTVFMGISKNDVLGINQKYQVETFQQETQGYYV